MSNLLICPFFSNHSACLLLAYHLITQYLYCHIYLYNRYPYDDEACHWSVSFITHVASYYSSYRKCHFHTLDLPFFLNSIGSHSSVSMELRHPREKHNNRWIFLSADTCVSLGSIHCSRLPDAVNGRCSSSTSNLQLATMSLSSLLVRNTVFT